MQDELNAFLLIDAMCKYPELKDTSYGKCHKVIGSGQQLNLQGLGTLKYDESKSWVDGLITDQEFGVNNETNIETKKGT